MPRGSKPGERRGGRQRATPNKRTVLTDRILAVGSANPLASFDELVAILVKDQALPADVRIAIARNWLAAVDSRSAKSRSRKGIARGLQMTERPAPTKLDRGNASTTPSPTIGASPSARTTTNRAMLPVLLDIVHDSATTPAERRQAASELAYYFLPKCPTQKKPRSRRHAADQYGFVVDPNVARELRDSKFKLACLPLSAKQLNPYAVAQKATKLHAGIKEIQDSLQCPCPSKYGLKRYIRLNGSETVIDGEIVQDRDRLNTLKKRRMDKGIFTPEEDVEETIRTARYDSFLMGPEMAARRRWAELRESKRGGDGGWGPPFKPAHHAEFRALTLLYPRSPNPEPSETFLADHPFRDLPIGKDDTLSSPKPPKRPTSTSPEPDPDKDFVEFVEIPPYCTVDRELTDKKGRLILKFTYEI